VFSLGQRHILNNLELLYPWEIPSNWGGSSLDAAPIPKTAAPGLDGHLFTILFQCYHNDALLLPWQLRAVYTMSINVMHHFCNIWISSNSPGPEHRLTLAKYSLEDPS
jgi:hypothetical protein